MAPEPANTQASGHSVGRTFELRRQYRFEAAHFLPEVGEAHPCRRVHGHGYRITISVTGNVDPQTGWVMDFAAIDSVVDPLLGRLDHRLLNDLEGLQNPTSENLASWLWRELQPHLPGLASITVAETDDSICIYRGPEQ